MGRQPEIFPDLRPDEGQGLEISMVRPDSDQTQEIAAGLPPKRPDRALRWSRGVKVT